MLLLRLLLLLCSYAKVAIVTVLCLCCNVVRCWLLLLSLIHSHSLTATSVAFVSLYLCWTFHSCVRCYIHWWLYYCCDRTHHYELAMRLTMSSACFAFHLFRCQWVSVGCLQFHRPNTANKFIANKLKMVNFSPRVSATNNKKH